ncbi:phospholipase D family protein [uncultured Desulfosarcina sp.]|uniref:phospholipase D family protein n=1 Tax=uncultured Desulfosarcina sp. TaxID=218289 RepID=UPI0029C85180|nr:phospholipase D family protein [uncultured Desulfosarcina sp.]
MHMVKNRLAVILAALCGIVWFTCCSSLPRDIQRPPSTVIEDGQATLLGRTFAEELANHPGRSGVNLLENGLDAFVSRVVLTNLAERSIDVQYYMYHQDTVGKLLVDQLIKAADRGVRVRMLIDDIYGSDADDVWTTLDAHPKMEVRLFNPFDRGASKNLQWITRFKEVNYRMHSKSFTVDNQATIVGGRNIGDEYFNANPELAFADLDLLAVGPVVPGVSEAFDQYWNSDWAYPASALAPPSDSGRLEDLRLRMAAFADSENAAAYIEALKNSNLANTLRAGRSQFEWAEAKVIHDSPEKKERGDNWESELLISQLWPIIQKATEELIIVSPYFVPGKKGAEALCDLCAKGVKVRILTNSLASNDVSAVHAGYAKYRKQLLKGGVELFELDEKVKNVAQKKFTWLPGLSKSSLHAKTMVLDRKAMFVGSMNLDQRSLNINNEICILFFNPEIAVKSAEAFDLNIEKMAFRLELDTAENGSGSIRWHLKTADGEVVYDSEPYVGFWKRMGVGLIRLLPVESLL